MYMIPFSANADKNHHQLYLTLVHGQKNIEPRELWNIVTLVQNGQQQSLYIDIGPWPE